MTKQSERLRKLNEREKNLSRRIDIEMYKDYHTFDDFDEEEADEEKADEELLDEYSKCVDEWEILLTKRLIRVILRINKKESDGEKVEEELLAEYEECLDEYELLFKKMSMLKTSCNKKEFDKLHGITQPKAWGQLEAKDPKM